MRLQITAPARVHFGLLQIDPAMPHCFGGLGLLLQTPSLQISVERADEFQVTVSSGVDKSTQETLEKKIFEAVQFAQHYFGSNDRAIGINIDAMPRLHSGLGMGTQLACAVVTAYAALRQYESTGAVSPLARMVWESVAADSSAHVELVRASGRGKRSHIGIEGFLRGGWIFDEGGMGNGNQRIVTKSPFPESWQVLLFLNDQLQGLSGSVEQASFDRGQSDNGQVSSQMFDLVVSEILPSLHNSNYDQFCGAIRRYNELAGELFIKRESPTRIQRYGQQLDNALSQLNISAFGQTSWGPTMWAVVPKSKIDANFLVSIHSKLNEGGLGHVSVHLADVSFDGATIKSL